MGLSAPGRWSQGIATLVGGAPRSLVLATGLLLQILPVQADVCDVDCGLPVQADVDCNRAQLLERAYPVTTYKGYKLQIKQAYVPIVDPAKIACGILPGRPDLIVAAIPLMAEHPPGKDRVRGDMEIIVADRATGDPLARRRERGMAGFDFLTYFQSVEFDANQHEYSDGPPAFGIRTLRQGYERLPYPLDTIRWQRPGSEQALWLYVYDNGNINRVLDGLIVERTKSASEYECYADDDTLQRTLSPGAQGATGHRDILVRQAIKHHNTRCDEDRGVNYSDAGDKCDCSVVSLDFDEPDLRFVFVDGKYRLEPGAALNPGFGDMAKYLMSTWRLDAESAD